MDQVQWILILIGFVALTIYIGVMFKLRNRREKKSGLATKKDVEKSSIVKVAEKMVEKNETAS